MDEDYPRTLLKLERRFSSEEAALSILRLSVGRPDGPGKLQDRLGHAA
jgi:hypothetical protein